MRGPICFNGEIMKTILELSHKKLPLSEAVSYNINIYFYIKKKSTYTRYMSH